MSQTEEGVVTNLEKGGVDVMLLQETRMKEGIARLREYILFTNGSKRKEKRGKRSYGYLCTIKKQT